jgi:hypothetical protein
MPLDALAAGPFGFSADTGAAHEMSVKVTHDTSPNKTIPSDFDECRMTAPLLHVDTTPEAASQNARLSIFGQTIDAAGWLALSPLDSFLFRSAVRRDS